ncbi:hypothetical protein [Sporosarcina koreensis]|uniref:hypothetical protein n=1 Tax=Sporosarcina koreensis TaxID=334735 RepID=UPI0007594CBB|nr:hypothetical protein [Sporosarcina koreensis]
MSAVEYEWIFRPDREADPYIIKTQNDDVLEAVTKFIETWGQQEIHSVQKVAKHIYYKEVV